MTEQPKDARADVDGRPGGDVERAVFDGEVIDTEPRRPALTLVRTPPGEVERRRNVQVIATVRAAATHDHTRAAARNVWFLLAGVVIVVKQWRDSHGASRYERMMRAAEAAGDREALLEWEARDVAEKAKRHQRVMNWMASPLLLVKAVALGIAAVTGLLLGLGVVLAIADGNAALVLGPIVGVIEAIRWTAWFVAAYGALLLIAATAGVVVFLWNVGRNRATPPAWINPAGLLPADENVTPSKVVLALRNLGIPALAKAIKAMEDAGGAMLGPIKIAGCGVEVDVRLPSGVSTAEIQGRRRKLAENLDRHEYEVFITIPAARTVRLWIADSGALDEPIGPSPLVIDQDITADIYTGRAPWARNLRGDAASISLKQRHLLITGLSNQGKTAALRALVLWAAFDVVSEFRLADLKGIGDWHMFQGLAAVLIEGPSDDHVIAATEMLEAGVREMERRLTSLDKDKYPNGVTRELARKPGSGFHPLFLVVDEAQVAFMCPAVDEDKRPYGGQKNTSRYFMACRKLHNQGRAVNVHLWQGTQDPTDQNLPKLVREGAHIRGSLAVGTESQSRMALGDKAVDGGAAPHLLRQGLDKGTLVLNGEGMELPPGENSITVRTHFVDGTDATLVANRAKERRRKRGRQLSSVADPEPIDHLANIHAALRGEPRVRTAVVLGRLIEHDPDTYEPWGFQDLAGELAREGVEIGKSDGQSVVRLKDVEEALARRVVELDGQRG